MPTRHALVFDLDGTLIDSAPDLLAALNRVLAEEDLPPVALGDVKLMVGDGAAKLVERGFTLAGSKGAGMQPDAARLGPLTDRFVGYYEAVVADQTRPFPGVPETLAHLAEAGYRLGVCTNKPAGPARDVLAALDLLGFFAVVHGGDSFPVRKPDPGHLHGTLAALAADHGTGVMIGDSPVDVATARAAGTPVIVHAHGYARVPVAELGADAVLEDFAALPGLLRQAPFS